MKNIIISMIVLLFVGCEEAEATSKETTDKAMESSIVDPTFDPVVVLFLDDMTFEEAFAIEHRAKGEGHTFWWHGEEYTTDLAVLDEFVLEHVNHDETRLGWVLNNDDPDDNCRSNKLDDCGVCDGIGRVTWFRDKDGDGLGTFMEWITSCTYPTDMEIKNYQAESLQEGGGDQGY
jgi:hypothetical protein